MFLFFDWIRINFTKCYTRAKKHSQKNKSKETPDFSIIRKDPIRETVTTEKVYQGDYLMNPENEGPHKMSQPFQHKVDYEGDTDEKIVMPMNYNQTMMI